MSRVVLFLFRFIGLFFQVLLGSRKALLCRLVALTNQLDWYKRKMPRPQVSDRDRLLWIFLKTIHSDWEKDSFVLQPQTVINWWKEFQKRYWHFISNRNRKPGRPAKSQEIKELIRQMAMDNISWRAPRVHKELLKLGFQLSEKTVSKVHAQKKTLG